MKMKITFLIFVIISLSLPVVPAGSTGFSDTGTGGFVSVNPADPYGNDMKEYFQQGRITGTVTDQNGSPLAGVTILIKGTTLGALTDASGRYSISNAPQNATLVFSFVGMTTQEIPTNGRQLIDVVMKEEAIGLEEVIVVGYGTQKRTTVTGSVSVVKGDDVANVPVPNVAGSIAGRMAGVIVRTNPGQPGEDNPYIYIRGIATTGTNTPLIVIDGIIRNNINQIDPNTIASVSVLKDAAAVAPYGLAGANGVILITTKKGTEGFPVLTLNSYYGWQTPTYFPHVLNAVDYMKLRNEAYLNEVPGGTNLPYSLDLISKYPEYNAKDPDKYPDSNTRDFVNMAAPVQKHNMEISGGSEKAKYYAGIGYFKQDGLFDRTNYSRFNYNLNLDLKVTNTTAVTLSLLGSSERTNDLDPEASSSRLFRGLFKFFPTDPLKFTNGFWGASAGNSPLGVINADSYDKTDGNTILSTITVEQQLPFIKGLSVKGSFSFDTRSDSYKGWHTPWYFWTQNTSTTPYTYTRSSAGLEGHTPYTYLIQSQTERRYYTYQGFINYQRTFGHHEVTGLIVAESRENQYNTFSARRNNFAVDVDELDMGSSVKTDYDNGGSSSVGTQIGYVYRAGYVYKNRYMLEASGRYDGHYYFAPGKKWGYFPAFSLGWRISEEDFMKGLSYINNLKIRGSWGKSGNLAGSAYQYLSGYTLAGNAYAFGTGTMVQRAYTAQEANPNITWEVSEKTDIGFEATLWNSLLIAEFDYFFEKRKGMLLSPAVTVPYEYGLSLAQENAGEMNNRGFDIMAGSRFELKNGLRLNIDGNISYAKNKMVQVFETDATYNNPNRRRTGRALNTLFGYHALGLFTTADDKNNDGIINSADGYNVIQFGTLSPGDIKYADISGPEGKPDGKIDSNDETVIGYPLYPRMTYGLNITGEWKGFDLNMFFQGSSMLSRQIDNFYTIAFENNKSNCDYEYYNNHWTITNENARYPRANTSPSANNTQTSDFWIMNTSHIRLKTASIGYTLPASVNKFLKIKNIRLYCLGQNLFTISNLKFNDPENGNSDVSYPVMKSYSFGATITF
jgi:TonB-linked SusC/RagA family outer membrane protein